MNPPAAAMREPETTPQSRAEHDRMADAAVHALGRDPDALHALPAVCGRDDAAQMPASQLATWVIDAFARELGARRGEAIDTLDRQSADTRYPVRPGHFAPNGRH